MQGRRERRKQETRAQILAAGRKLFAEKGLWEPSIEELTTRAGIAKGTIYGYFADKDALIRAVVGEGFAALAERVRAAAGDERDDSERVARVVRAPICCVSSTRCAGC